MTGTPKATDTADGPKGLKRETEKITSKIDAAFAKLAKKYRGRSDEAKGKMETAKGKTKQAILLRRFELYGDAAHQLEARSEGRKADDEGD